MALDWNKMRIFYEVARIRNFSRASEVMGLSQSAISRHVRALEDYLSITLFHRHARGLKLTEQGELLFQATAQIADQLYHAEEQMSSKKDKPIGLLRVTATMGFGSHWLVPRLKEFIDRYPDIELQLRLTDQELDLGMREADIAVRFRRPEQLDLVFRSLFTVHYQIIASPEYLTERGIPKTVEDLDDHDIVVYGETAPVSLREVNWLMHVGRKPNSPRKPKLRADSLMGVLLALQTGLGIGILPNYITPTERGLTRVLEDIQPPSFKTFIVYPEELRGCSRIEVFRDFLLQKMQNWRY